MRPIAQDRGVAVVLNGRPDLAVMTGCDGVVLDDPKTFSAARKTIGANGIVGVRTGASRHEAMTAAEAGADFVGLDADPDLIAWWAELMEPPCIAFGAIGPTQIPDLVAAGADFIAVDSAVWDHSDPAPAAAAIQALL